MLNKIGDYMKEEVEKETKFVEKREMVHSKYAKLTQFISKREESS